LPGGTANIPALLRHAILTTGRNPFEVSFTYLVAGKSERCLEFYLAIALLIVSPQGFLGLWPRNDMKLSRYRPSPVMRKKKKRLCVCGAKGPDPHNRNDPLGHLKKRFSR
jgi:hypothetical protein